MKIRLWDTFKDAERIKIKAKKYKATSAQNYRCKRFLQKQQVLETCHGELHEMRNNLRRSASKT